jgi:peptidoglycan/xylan/chitin deacetylase (PgdA/CDA1 family)
MKIRIIALALAATFAVTGCGKIKLPSLSRQRATPTPMPATPAPAAAPATTATADSTAPAAPAAPTPPPKPAAPAVDKTAQVIVLCYHRLEGKAGGAYSIEPALFEKHMQELKDRNIAVISMQDFMAWRRGAKNIPPKSAIITIDDGYASGAEVGVPILKKFGYLATYFVYTNYLNSGGKSLTWAQLGQLRDEGFEIGSHTVSHVDLRSKPKTSKFATYEEWLKDELERSKQILEEQLGIRVATVAYPAGGNSPKILEASRAAGYELGFTTYGQRVTHGAAPYSIGRYDVTAKDAQGHDGFTAAISFQGPVAASGPVVAQEAQAMMLTEPMNGAVTNNARPRIKANLASLGTLDPNSVKMRISGLGLVTAQYEPGTQDITFTPPTPLRPGSVTVIISGNVGTTAVETKWSFRFDPNAQPGSDATALDQVPPPPR